MQPTAPSRPPVLLHTTAATLGSVLVGQGLKHKVGGNSLPFSVRLPASAPFSCSSEGSGAGGPGAHQPTLQPAFEQTSFLILGNSALSYKPFPLGGGGGIIASSAESDVGSLENVIATFERVGLGSGHGCVLLCLNGLSAPDLAALQDALHRAPSLFIFPVEAGGSGSSTAVGALEINAAIQAVRRLASRTRKEAVVGRYRAEKEGAMKPSREAVLSLLSSAPAGSSRSGSPALDPVLDTCGSLAAVVESTMTKKAGLSAGCSLLPPWRKDDRERVKAFFGVGALETLLGNYRHQHQERQEQQREHLEEGEGQSE